MPAAVDPQFDKTLGPVLGSPNPFKLGLFGINFNAGLVMSFYDGVPKATWEENVRLARKADAIGVEALIPLARWKAYSDHGTGGRGFDPFTWAAGLASVTERIGLFATFHIPTMHPVLVAKMAATIDHISGGRFGLNLVAGWQPEEIAMFGTTQREHDERYDVADDWVAVAKRLWTETEAFNYDGPHYTIPGAYSEPKPLQQPYPLLMSAGVSPAGRAFAAKNTDLVFAVVEDPTKIGETIAEIKREAREEHGKDLLVFVHGNLVVRDSEEEAQAYYDEVYHRHGDWDAGRNVLSTLMGHSQTIDWEAFEIKRLLESTIRGFFAYPMIGTPDQIVRTMVSLSEAGLDGMALSIPDNDDGLDRLDRQIMPLLVEAGLRTAKPSTALV
jgi:alkanesulfonate monooxygenase SsuD/methylene tetrahydromethanopterin reductase-like flavin-dependent oxidoreductase (luciferase family)